MSKDDQVKWGHVAENIEEKILDSIRKGMSSGEHISIRPLREVFQNCDDEFSDRFYISINPDALYFMNDGNRLTVEFNQNKEPIAGTCRMITGISMASKKRDKDKAGNFGTGLRSAHAISHFIEVHGRTTYLIETDEIDEYGDKISKPWHEKPEGVYFGRSNAYNKTLEEDGKAINFSVRDSNNRPKRTRINTRLPRDGILIRLPWRREIHPGSVDRSEWEELTWDDKKIEYVSELYKKEIPRILMGCSWLREVVLDVSVGTNKFRHAWVRDFNHREYEDKQSINNVKLTQYKGELRDFKSGLSFGIENDLKKVKSTKYHLISEPNLSLREVANAAELLPTCHILVPNDPNEMLPAYTPIALAGDSGNHFGPISFLPPDDSRTKIKIDGVKRTKQLWAAKAINSLTEILLPRVLTHTMKQFKNQPLNILKLLPKQKPTRWFTSGLGMSMPHLSEVDGSSSYILNNKIEDTWKNLNHTWNEYRELVSNAKIFPTSEGEWISPKTIIRIDLQDSKKTNQLREIFEALGETVVTPEQYKVLCDLNKEDWGHENPLHQMEIISQVHHLKSKLETLQDKITLDLLGEKLVRELIQIVHINPPEEWINDLANRRRIPCVPNAEGKLISLIDEKDNSNFYSDSEQFPDLIPDHRRIDERFANLSQHFNLQTPAPEELSELIDEGARNRPKVFANLQNHQELHKQISLALELMSQGNFPTQQMRNQKFIPCLYKGKIITKEMGKVGINHVWPIDSIGKATRTSFQGRDMIFGDSAEKRSELNLHKEVFNNLFWLELHPQAEEGRQKICEKLHANNAISANPGVNIIRSLIFAQPIPTTNHEDNSLFHRSSDGTWELDNWIGKKLGTQSRDEILESLLRLLRKAADNTAHKGMSTGWGADSREKVHSLYLLKDENNKWSTMGNLCYDLRSDLSNLFGKTAVLESHRSLLGHKVITNEVGKSSGAGLGITHRFGELEIKEKIGKITAATSEVRSRIIGMMLASEEPWNLNPEIGLEAIEWVPTFENNTMQLNRTILPSPEMVKLLGSNHPWNIITDLDCTSESVQERAKELGINCESEGVEFIHNALLSPETVWPEFEGKDILRHLQNKFNDNNKLITNGLRKPRLPDNSGKWHDDSWLVGSELLDNAKLIFPERNIVTAANIGGTDVATMAKQWILPVPCGPKFNDLVGKLRTMSTLGKTNVNKKELQALWDLISGMPAINLSLSKEETNDFLIIIDSQIIKLGELFITNEESAPLIDDEETKGLSPLDESSPLVEILEQTFKVINLNDCKVSDLQIAISDLESSEFQSLSIQRYWVILASLASRYHKLINEEVWLLISATGYSFSKAKPEMVQTRKALIPEIDDSRENIKRMSDKKLSLLWLPRSGLIQSTIYDGLERTSAELPFLRKIARPKTASFEDGDKEDWPVLTIALQNILEALIITENSAYPNINTAKVSKTTESISSELYAKTSTGTPDVFWKQSNDTESMYLSINQSEKSFELIISVKDHKLDDEMIIHHLCKNIVKFDNSFAKALARKLVSRDESRWVDFNSILDHEENSWTETARPLITTGIYKEFSVNMANWYGGCQVCGQQTPADRLGGFQEGVVSLFKEQGGRYYSDSIRYHQGNVMYLCPVHKSLYSRSKYSDLMWIPDIDDAKEQLDKTPTKEKLKEIIDSVLGTTGPLTLEVKTYEKTPGDQETGPSEKTNKVEWKKKHASSFRDALTQYLTGLLN